jgi:hypothetical protein
VVVVVVVVASVTSVPSASAREESTGEKTNAPARTPERIRSFVLL